MNMFDFENKKCFEICEKVGRGFTQTFNYNIVVKINNGPVKHFFYKGYCYHNEYKEIKEKLEKFIKNLYEREFEIEIISIPDIIENKDKYTGNEIIINNGCFIIK